jgi:monovalent cation/hydrogen antiporter
VFISSSLPQTVRLFGRDRAAPSWRTLAVVSWTGMRGVVTLAAAAGVPAGTPGRAEIQLFAFAVAVGTVLVQGLTLPPLIRALKVEDPSEASRDEAEELAAREVAKKAAKERLREISRERLASLDLPPERVSNLKERLERLIDMRYRFAKAAITLSGEERSGSPQAQFAKGPARAADHPAQGDDRREPRGPARRRGPAQGAAGAGPGGDAGVGHSHEPPGLSKRFRIADTRAPTA